MWPAVSEHLLGFAAACCVGWAIRLMDDALDQEVDQVVGRTNLADRLQGGTTAYALLTLVLAVSADRMVTLSLFAGAYAVGMMGDQRQLPSGLPGWLEGLLVMAVALAQVGLPSLLAGGLIMLMVQLLDDWQDRRIDHWRHTGRALKQLGPIGAGLVAFLSCVVAVALNPALVYYSLPVFCYFQWRERR